MADFSNLYQIAKALSLTRIYFMNTVSNKPDRKEEDKEKRSMSTKAPLTERIMKKAATAALTFGVNKAYMPACLDIKQYRRLV